MSPAFVPVTGPESFLTTTNCHLSLAYTSYREKDTVLKGYFQAEWVLCTSSKGVYVFAFQRDLIILDFLKKELNIMKGMLKISLPYLGKSAGKKGPFYIKSGLPSSGLFWTLTQ